MAQATYTAGRAAQSLSIMTELDEAARSVAADQARFFEKALGKMGGTWECAYEYAETLKSLRPPSPDELQRCLTTRLICWV